MYKTGSIAVTNNSAIVTGSGTLWVDAGVLNPGDLIFCPDGTLQEVLSFQSNTQLTLAGDGHGNTVYLGATLAGQAYGIVPIGMLPSSLALQVKTTLNAAQAAIGSAVLSTAAQGLTTTQQTNARANILALGASDVGKGLLSKSVAGGVEVVLTAAEAANQFIELTGALTASINLVVPAAARLFVIRNSTTGAYTVTVKTSAGTGVTVLQGGRMLIECDGTNCVDALSYMRQTGGSVDGTPVGATTPAAGSFTTLSANGPLSISSAGPFLDLKESGTSVGLLASTDVFSGTAKDVVLYGRAGKKLHFWSEGSVSDTTPGSAVLSSTGLAVTGALSASGNLFVGVTSGAGHTISKNTATEYALVVQNSSTSAGVYGLMSYLSGAASGTATSFFDCIDSGGQKLKIAGTGNVTNLNNSYGALSDLKLKENIVDCTPKLPKLMQVRIVNYNLKTDPLHKQLGVIAQELELISPGLVEETPDYIVVTKTREVPKTVAVTVKQEQPTQRTVIDIIDGKAVQTVSTEIALIDVQVFDEYLVIDAAGNTVLELETLEVAEVLDEAGAVVTPFKAAVYRQAIHRVARTQTVTEIETYTERELTGTVTKSVKYSVFVPMLIKAMQEQQEIIDAQSVRITALEAK